MKELLYLRNVATLKLDAVKCTGCGMCLEVCPRAVLARNSGKILIAALDACIECGACQLNCPADALTVHAGVGCAQAVINAALGRTSADCCCTVESREACGPASSCAPPDGSSEQGGCC